MVGNVQNSSKEPKVNDAITDDPVRLVDAEGEMVGVVPLAEAFAKAEETGLDLMVISPNADPPVCKLLDYGKFKYEAQKKASEARKKQKTTVVKEIKMRLTIDVHDLEVKLRKVKEFIEHDDKVKISIRFRGREMAHKERAYELVDQVKAATAEYAKFDQEPKMEGNVMGMLLGPLK